MLIAPIPDRMVIFSIFETTYFKYLSIGQSLQKTVSYL